MLKFSKKIFFLFAFIILMSSAIFALGTDQTIIEKPVQLNKKYNLSFRVYTDKPAVLIDVYNWTIDPNGNSIIFQDQPFKGTWLKIPKVVEKKDPKAKYIDVNYVVKITSAKQVEYLAKLIVSESDKSNSNINIATCLGIPVYFWIDNKIQMNKNSCDITKVAYDTDKKVLTALVVNKANMHIRPNIDMKIFRKTYDSFLVKDTEIVSGNFTAYWPILAQSERSFQKQVNLAKGNYKIVFKLNWGNLSNLDFNREIVKDLVVE